MENKKEQALDEDILDEFQDEIDDEIDDEKSEQIILYKNRVRKLIKDVGKRESFSDIRIGKLGLERMDNTIRFITVILIYEVIELMKKEHRKVIKPKFIDDALNRTIVGADALGFSISKLQELLQQLESQNNCTSIGKAVDFINIYDNSQDEEE